MIVALLMASAGASPSLSVTPRTCRQVSRLRSIYTADERRREHAFQNGLAVPLTLSWVDPAGKRTAIGTISPGAILSQQTNLGHAFVLTDPAGKCRATVRIGEVLSGSYIGASRYRAVAVPGWHVYVDRLLDPVREPARAALATLGRMLVETQAALPPAALAEVRRTPIFLHKHSGPGGMFHRNPGWLVSHGRTVELTNAIEVSDASMFVETARTQPSVLMHELAHAYYFRLSDTDRADIEANYRQAMTRGLYRAVRRHDGMLMEAYAASNAAEYFAELSEAHFGRNDFYLFTRAELAVHDRDGARMMARIWR